MFIIFLMYIISLMYIITLMYIKSLRFNVDCEASSGLYGLAEGAFGTAGKGSCCAFHTMWNVECGISTTLSFLCAGGSAEGGDAGQCPAASALSEAECAGAVSTCWSPGQRDTDCPNNGLCCVSIEYLPISPNFFLKLSQFIPIPWLLKLAFRHFHL